MTRPPSRNSRARVAPGIEERPVDAPAAASAERGAERACVEALRRIAELQAELASATRVLAENLPRALAERAGLSLMSLMHPIATEPLPPELLNCKQLAGLLQIHERTLRRMRRAGEVPPPIKAGRGDRWRRAIIESWLSEREERAK